MIGICTLSYLSLSSQILNYFSCNDQADYGRNEGCGTWNITTLCTFMCCARRADAVCTAADRHILDRADWLLLRVYHFELLNSTFFEFTTHNFCQRADGCFVDVCYLKSSRVEFVSGSILLMIGTPASLASMTSWIFAVTVSTASTTQSYWEKSNSSLVSGR